MRFTIRLSIILIAPALCAMMSCASSYPILEPLEVTLPNQFTQAGDSARLRGNSEKKWYEFTAGGNRAGIPFDRVKNPAARDRINQNIWISGEEIEYFFGYQEPADHGYLRVRDGTIESVTVMRTPEPLDGNYLSPGWFDVGVGMGQIFNAHHGRQDNGRNTDVLGTFLSIRAYPFGRWYTAGLDGKRQVTLGITRHYRWYQRMSVVYGLSLESGLNSTDAIDGEAHVFGLGFDFAPQYSVIAGMSLFELQDGYSPGQHDPAFFLGVSLNLNSFRALLDRRLEFAKGTNN